jgi:hypothetical protein
MNRFKPGDKIRITITNAHGAAVEKGDVGTVIGYNPVQEEYKVLMDHLRERAFDFVHISTRIKDGWNWLVLDQHMELYFQEEYIS